MKVDIERPNITDNIDILKQIRRYLTSLAEKLQWAYDTEALRNNKNIEQLRDCVDYVVETGVDDIWEYRKWKSGKYDAFYSSNEAFPSVTTNVPSGALFRSGSGAIRLPSFNKGTPPTFSVKGSMTADYSDVWAHPDGNYIWVEYWSFKEFTSPARLSIYVHGTWK